jgi:hypothetical protein
MSFFQWIPNDSNQTVSPWIAVYFGLTTLVTVSIYWLWRKWEKEDTLNIEDFVDQVIDSDVEKGSTYTSDTQRSLVNQERKVTDQ